MEATNGGNDFINNQAKLLFSHGTDELRFCVEEGLVNFAFGPVPVESWMTFFQ